MEVELQYTPDAVSFYETNQNAEIELNEKALNKNKSLNTLQKNAFKNLVQDINKYSDYNSLSGGDLVEATDKYQQLMNLSGIYGIRDYIKTGKVTGKQLIKGDGGSEGYISNFPGCPKESDLKKGYVPKTWIDSNGVEFTTEEEWTFNKGTGQWEGLIAGEVIYKNRNEVPEWELFVPQERFIKRISLSIPTQLPMGRNGWLDSMRRQRSADGSYQARVGTSR